MKDQRLPDAELDVMMAIWENEEPKSSTEILEAVSQKRSWQLPTLMTVLSRLVNKGFLQCEKQGRFNLYTAHIAKDDYIKSESKTMLEKLYGNSISSLVASLAGGGAISAEELRELRETVDTLAKE